MTGQVLISHSPEDQATAAYLINDLGRQGLLATAHSPGDERAVDVAAVVVIIASNATTASQQVWSDADQAARAAKPLYVVRLGDASGHAFSAMPVRLWTDAFGPNAQANVGRLAHDLRTLLAHVAETRARTTGTTAGAFGTQPTLCPVAARDQLNPGSEHSSALARQPKWIMILSLIVGVLLMISGLLKIFGVFR